MDAIRCFDTDNREIWLTKRVVAAGANAVCVWSEENFADQGTIWPSFRSRIRLLSWEFPCTSRTWSWHSSCACLTGRSKLGAATLGSEFSEVF